MIAIKGKKGNIPVPIAFQVLILDKISEIGKSCKTISNESGIGYGIMIGLVNGSKLTIHRNTWEELRKYFGFVEKEMSDFNFKSVL